MLEEQLEGSRKRCEKIFSLENELLRVKADLNSALLEREADKSKIEDLNDQNLALQMNNKSSLSESKSLQEEMQSLRGNQSGRKADTNILSEQIDRDVTRIHRLELENQKLQSELDNLKENGFAESSEKILTLEKENKKLSMTVNQLEELHGKDSDFNVKLEAQISQLQTQNQRSDEIVQTVRESEQQLRVEKETEIENLKKEVSSLRMRQQITQNEQLAYLEEENTKLVKVSLFIFHEI